MAGLREWVYQASSRQTAFAAQTQALTYGRSEGDVTRQALFLEALRACISPMRRCFGTQVSPPAPPRDLAKHLDWESTKPTYQWPKIVKVGSQIHTSLTASKRAIPSVISCIPWQASCGTNNPTISIALPKPPSAFLRTRGDGEYLSLYRRSLQSQATSSVVS